VIIFESATIFSKKSASFQNKWRISSFSSLQKSFFNHLDKLCGDGIRAVKRSKELIVW